MTAVLAFLVAGCGTTETPLDAGTRSGEGAGSASTAVIEKDAGTRLAGFALSPPELTGEGLVTFFEEASESAFVAAWIGPWTDLNAKDSAARVAVELAVDHGLIPVIITGFPPDGQGGRLMPDDPAPLFDAIEVFLSDHPVPYLGVGVEIDLFMGDHDPADLERFVAWFPELVSRVHEASPSTSVFPGFQLERTRGLKGGLFGGVNDPSDHGWDLIARFPDADAIGFTTYPGLVFTDPSDLPADYYSSLRAVTDKPVLFTEVGWQAGGELRDWSGTPEEQAEFVRLWVPEMLEVGELIVWSFLWDQAIDEPAFMTMGMRHSEGERPALTEWRRILRGRWTDG